MAVEAVAVVRMLGVAVVAVERAVVVQLELWEMVAMEVLVEGHIQHLGIMRGVLVERMVFAAVT